MTRAVLQGVAFAIRDCQLALQSAGTTLTRAAAIGGGARSDYWLRVIANTLGIPLDVTAEGDFGASLGAARLGMIAAETADPLSVCTAPAIDHTVEPDRSCGDFGAEHERYKSAYAALAPLMRHA